MCSGIARIGPTPFLGRRSYKAYKIRVLIVLLDITQTLDTNVRLVLHIFYYILFIVVFILLIQLLLLDEIDYNYCIITHIALWLAQLQVVNRIIVLSLLLPSHGSLVLFFPFKSLFVQMQLGSLEETCVLPQQV